MDDILTQMEKEIDDERRRQYLAKWGILNKDKKLTEFEMKN